MALGRGAGRCGGDGGRCSAFPGFSSVRGSSVTKSRSRARPLARGTEGSGLGEHPALGFPLPSWGTPILIGLEMLLKLAYCKGTWSLVSVWTGLKEEAAAPVPTTVGPHVQSLQAQGRACAQVSGSCSRCE